MKIEQNYKPSPLSYNDTVNSSDQGPQKTILQLLSVLQGYEVALDLQFKVESEDIASELSALFRRVWNGNFNYEHYCALSWLVIKQALDVNIWNAVFDLIITVSWTTPSTSISIFYDSTSLIHSLILQQGAEQTHQLMKTRIFEEIRHYTYQNVEEFFQKYFEEKKWTEQDKDIYNVMKSQHVDRQWIDFPDPSEQNAVWEWLHSFQNEFLFNTQGIYYTTRAISDLISAEVKQQLDLFVKQRSDTTSLTHHWKDVQVIAEHKQSKSKGLKPLLLQLSRYMCNVFIAQPTHRFIHGFFLYETTMKLWVFDHSSPYSSNKFNIHEEPEQFIQAITEYTMMSDEELGLNTFIERNEEDLFITIMKDVNEKKKKIQLEKDSIIIQQAIVCWGTNCLFKSSQVHLL